MLAHVDSQIGYWSALLAHTMKVQTHRFFWFPLVHACGALLAHWPVVCVMMRWTALMWHMAAVASEY